MNNDYRYENRKFVIVGIVLAIVAVFIGRLFSLQVMNDEYKKHADSNAFLNKTIYPSRGVMYGSIFNINRSDNYISYIYCLIIRT